MDQATPHRLAIVGPGRVGRSLARAWREAGHTILGFLGPEPAVAAALGFVGDGRALAAEDLTQADAVLVSVQDDRLAAAVAALPAVDAVWFHASGSHDLSVLAPMRAAGRKVGAVHPLSPFPDAERGYANLAGQPAVVLTDAADTSTAEFLAGLATAAGLQPIQTHGGDRLIYHAACVLAANGLTALYGAVERLLGAGLGAEDAAVGDVPHALMGAALRTCHREGSVAALSGPVARGDAGLVAKQLDAVRQLDPELAAIYQSLMLGAVRLTQARGERSPEEIAKVREVLRTDA